MPTFRRFAHRTPDGRPYVILNGMRFAPKKKENTRIKPGPRCLVQPMIGRNASAQMQVCVSPEGEDKWETWVEVKL